jgi:hypothetical protein
MYIKMQKIKYVFGKDAKIRVLLCSSLKDRPVRSYPYFLGLGCKSFLLGGCLIYRS